MSFGRDGCRSTVFGFNAIPAIDFTVSCPLLPTYLPAAVSDPQAVILIATRATEKTAKHAAGSASRNRLFLPWVITTFGGMGTPSIWHYIDTIYAASASLARLSNSTFHAVARRKASFLATLQATLIRSCFAMLTAHTSASAPDPPTQPSAPPTAPGDPASPTPSRSTTPEPDNQ